MTEYLLHGGNDALDALPHPRVVRLLLARGANPRAVTTAGFTALHYAAQDDAKPTKVCLLLKAGASAVAVDKEYNTPADVANEFGFKNIEMLLRRAMLPQ